MNETTGTPAPDAPPEPVTYGSPELIAEVTQFLAYDAQLLDEWRLREWFALFTPDCRYIVPSTDRRYGDPLTDLFFVRDDWFLLSQRVDAMVDGSAWTESPPSITHRTISNVRASEDDDGVRVWANLVVYRSRKDGLTTYPAHLELHLVRGGHAGFEIRRRVSRLALEELRPHGRVSILL